MTQKREKIRKPKPMDGEAMAQSIKTDAIDGRTKQARHIKRIKDGLTDAPINTAKALLKALVAQNTVISQEIYNAALNSGSLIDTKGKLNPLIEKSLVKYQNGARAALDALLRLEGGNKTDGEAEDIFADVFE